MSDTKNRIPIPLSQKLREIRVRVLPFLVFITVLGAVVYLWDMRVNTPGFTGKVVGDSTMVTTPNKGKVEEFFMEPFERVQQGDPVAVIEQVDSAYYQARLNLIESEIRQIRVSREPVLNRQRNLLDYENLKLENMQNRVELASIRIQLQQKETEFERAKKLIESDGMSEQEFQRIESEYRVLQSQVQQKANLVDTLQQRLEKMNELQVNDESVSPIATAIRIKEQELKLIEEELKPIILRAPISGVVSEIFANNSEYVQAGDQIMKIESDKPSFIIGYVRQPFDVIPQQGMQVQVRTRKPSRDFFSSYILKIGGHIKLIEEGLQRPGLNRESGLPVQIAIDQNKNIQLYPGEIVDVVLQP